MEFFNMEMFKHIVNYFVVIWTMAFPFVYGIALSRMFGLTKAIDHWILVVLHILLSTFTLIPYSIAAGFFSAAELPTTVCFVLPIILFGPAVIMTEGCVWHFTLRDRKKNGFLCSLICNLAYLIPYIPVLGILSLGAIFKW